MKKVDFLKTLSELTGIEAEKIVEHVTSEEEELEGVEIAEKHIFTEDELTARLKNHGSKSGVTAVEMAVKDARNDFELEFEGKTIKNLVNAAMEKAKTNALEEAKIKPNEQLAEKDKVIDGLRKSIIKIEEEKDAKITELSKSISTMQEDNVISSLIPTNLDTPLSNSDLKVLFRNEFGTKKNDDGKLVFTDKSGEILKDEKTQEPLSGKVVIDQFLETKNIKVKNGSGRGGDDDNIDTKVSLGNIKTTKDFYDYCAENKVSDREQVKLLTEIQKENPDFALEG